MQATVQNVLDHELRVFKGRLGGDAAVDKAMRDLADAEERVAARRRLEYQEIVQQTHERKRVEAELKDAQGRLAKVRKVNREESMVMEARGAVKSYSPEMFGHGKRKGGGAQYQKVRLQALDRVRAVGRLSMEQVNDWAWFAKEWDTRMAETDALGDATETSWGEHFAQILASLVARLNAGEDDAVSAFMRTESERVLRWKPVLRIPGRG